MRGAWPIALLSTCVACLGAQPALGADGAGCKEKEVRAALVSFVSAYNRGDYRALDGLFAPEPDFQWYSTPAPGERLSLQAKRRGTLIRYFEARHARHDRLDLTSFGFNGNGSYQGGTYGNFEMGMRRKARGFRHGDWFRADGKGAAMCEGRTARFVVLTFGGPVPGQSG